MLEILNFRASFCYHLKYLLEFLLKSQTLQEFWDFASLLYLYLLKWHWCKRVSF